MIPKSKQEAKQELEHCKQDPAHFIRNYVTISHPGKGYIPFILYDFQEELLSDFLKFDKNIILKARQLGISTLVAAYVGWLLLFHRGKDVLILCTDQKKATTILRKIKILMERLPKWMQALAVTKADNQTSIELVNGSRVVASTTTKKSGRSDALSLLVVDEAAHIEQMEDVWTAIEPATTVGGGRCIALSSPNGVGNWFYDVYSNSRVGKNDWHYTDLPWQVHPDRDQKWFEKETRELSPQQIAQEYSLSFNSSINTFITPERIKEMFDGTREPIDKAGFDRNYYVWQRPMPNRKYFISADVARGDGSDYSVFHVFDTETMYQAAEYQGKLPTEMFAELLFNVGMEYGFCMVVVENNVYGSDVLTRMIEREYPNLYFTRKTTMEYVEHYAAMGREDTIPGFVTTVRSRPLILAKLEQYLRNGFASINSKRFCGELETFIWKNGKPEATSKSNDDLILAAAIACYVRDVALVADQKGISDKKALLGGILLSTDALDTRIPGMRGYDRNKDPFKTSQKSETIGGLPLRIFMG